MSQFGKNYRITSFGESHAPGTGVIIENMIPNFELNLDKVQKQLTRRRPGQSHLTTPRDEKDKLELLAGMERGKTLGTPLAFLVRNRNTKPEDYQFDEKEYLPRPSHSDFTYFWKYGIHASSGGGRSSARETIARVIGGAVAEQVLDKYNIKVIAWVSSVGDISLDQVPDNISRELVDRYVTRCPDQEISDKMENLIVGLKEEGDSVGGTVSCIISNLPRGLGEPVFDKTEALIAQAMLSIPATKAFEFGSGFKGCTMLGSQHNDPWIKDEEKITTKTNNNGGLIGGITNGENLYFKVGFKPPATIKKKQNTVTLDGREKVLAAKGRHDPCVVPRAVPIVESMASMVILDLMYQQGSRYHLSNSNPFILF